MGAWNVEMTPSEKQPVLTLTFISSQQRDNQCSVLLIVFRYTDSGETLGGSYVFFFTSEFPLDGVSCQAARCDMMRSCAGMFPSGQIASYILSAAHFSPPLTVCTVSVTSTVYCSPCNIHHEWTSVGDHFTGGSVFGHTALKGTWRPRCRGGARRIAHFSEISAVPWHRRATCWSTCDTQMHMNM